MASFHQHTNGEEVAKTFASRIKGKTFVLTGPSSGSIGGATAISLAYGSPATIFLCGRTLSKVTPVIDSIKAINSAIDVIFIPLDLSDLDSVRASAKQVLENAKAEKIHGLINVAGIMCTMPFTKSKQGIEIQFATNHVGHFLWTNLLLERVIEARGEHARIVNVASTGYVITDVLFDGYNFEDGKTYQPWIAYGSSKAANILFNTYLSSHLKPKGIDCFALQPGMPQTNLYVHTKDENSPASLPAVYKMLGEKYGDNFPPIGGPETDVKTVETSASTLVVAAVDDRFDGKGGLFLKNCQVLDTTATPWITDPSGAERLWKLSEELVGEKFDI